MPSTPAASAAARMPARTDTVGRQFDRRAARYAQHGALPREIERRLLERLDAMRVAPARIVDLGCGAGASRAHYAQRFPRAAWLGVDLSPAMLRARPPAPRRWLARLAGGAPPALVCADAARLPLADACCDLVHSNLMPHWHPAPPALFAEMRRVLCAGGLLLFSAFGPDTAKELRAACAQALPQARPLAGIDLHDYGDMLVASGFAAPVMEVERLTLTYPSPRALLRELRALGGNPRDDRPRALPSTRQARALLDALAAQRAADGRIALSVEAVYGHAWAVAGPRRETAIPLAAVRAGLRRP